MRYFDHILDIVLEDVASKMSHLVDTLLSKKKSRWYQKRSLVANPQDPPNKWKYRGNAREVTAKFIEDVIVPIDPTLKKKYIRYIVAQVAAGNLVKVQEDGPALTAALGGFDAKRNDWNGESDVFAYPDYRKLVSDVSEYWASKETASGSAFYEAAMNELKSVAYANTNQIFNRDIFLSDSDGDRIRNVVVYEMMSWQAAMWWGWAGGSKPNQWCTSAGPQASRANPFLNNIPIGGNVERTVSGQLNRIFGDRIRMQQLPNSIWSGWARQDFLDDTYKLNGWDPGVPLSDIKAKDNNQITIANEWFLYAMHYGPNYGFESRNEPIYIIRKDDDPYMQWTCKMDGGEYENVDNLSPAVLGHASVLIITSLISDGKMHEVACKNMVPEIVRNAKRSIKEPKMALVLKVLAEKGYTEAIAALKQSGGK